MGSQTRPNRAAPFRSTPRFHSVALPLLGGGVSLTERPNPIPYAKNYDAIAEEHPSSWSRRFDLSHWGLFGAYIDGSLVGAAAGVRGFPIQDEGSDVAMLWDIRVSRNITCGGDPKRTADSVLSVHSSLIWGRMDVAQDFEMCNRVDIPPVKR
jgi:hypothetical protein